MRYFFILCFSLYTTTCFAQKQFEGTIIYRLHAEKETEEPELTVNFGKNALRMRFKEKDRYDKQELLVILDSGALYTLNTETKEYRVKKLKTGTTTSNASPEKTIAGYKAKLSAVSNYAIQQFIGMLGANGVDIYISDELVYSIPPQYAGNLELAMIADNKIILAIASRQGFDQESAKAAFTGEAVQVKPMSLPAADFMIPQDYVLEKEAVYDETMIDDAAVADTAAIAMDTAVAAMPEEIKPAPKPKPKPPVKKKTKPGTSPARKPE